MVDNEMALTFSVRNNPGVYALLLGSGVSKGAGIPTGWGVVEDLIRKVAKVKGADPEKPFEWYEEKYNRPARYDELVESLASSKEERRSLLEEYFEPTDEEREDRIKTPSEAHRSIAWLMKKRYINVVLTTNFDNLLETALRERGVEPTVISTTDAARGAEPLAHIGPVILKIHGDYKETNLKNTTEELSSYDEPMKKLIDVVLNDYGLIICGWSGDTDTALRKAILGTEDRRYSTFWTYRSGLSDLAEEIITHRKGFKLQISGANQFFSELKENVRALEKAEDGAPLTREIIRERTKHYLTRKERRIDLSDLLKRETERVYSQVFDYSSLPLNENLSEETVEDRLSAYEQQTEKLVIATSTCAYWGPEVVNPALKTLKGTVKRLGSPPTGSPFNHAFKYLSAYPATRTYYAIGIAVVEAENWDLLVQLMNVEVKDGTLVRPVATDLSPTKVCSGMSSGRPINDGMLKYRLKENLRSPFEDLIPDKQRYEDAFETFELVSDMVLVDWQGKAIGTEINAPNATYSESQFEALEDEYQSEGGLQQVLHECIQPEPETRVPELFNKFRNEQPWW